jgi:hypothetical protein
MEAPLQHAASGSCNAMRSVRGAEGDEAQKRDHKRRLPIAATAKLVTEDDRSAIRRHE